MLVTWVEVGRAQQFGALGKGTGCPPPGSVDRVAPRRGRPHIDCVWTPAAPRREAGRVVRHWATSSHRDVDDRRQTNSHLTDLSLRRLENTGVPEGYGFAKYLHTSPDDKDRPAQKTLACLFKTQITRCLPAAQRFALLALLEKKLTRPCIVQAQINSPRFIEQKNSDRTNAGFITGKR
ncbi:hypothetical protein J6590_027600 [Homalodisca vitripennis]|nr:hypothetical protein J6590_027600 [Homalodisca vitripennis]